MKSISVYIIICCVVVLFVRCNKNSELIYSADKDLINVWLGTKATIPDSLEYNFGYKSLNDLDSILFTARLTGEFSDKDRPFYLTAVAGDTSRVLEGVHYSFGNYILKANTCQAVFPIYIHRTSYFKNHPARIVFGVSDKGVLKSGLSELSHLIITFRDTLSKPLNWDADVYPYSKLSTYFGTYSRVKFQFITTVTGRPPIFRILVSGTPQTDEISFTEAIYYENSCKKRLSIYNAEHPESLLKNENNEVVTFP